MPSKEGSKEASSQRALEGAQLFKACPQPATLHQGLEKGHSRRKVVTVLVTHPHQRRSLVNQQPQPCSALTREPTEPETHLQEGAKVLRGVEPLETLR